VLDKMADYSKQIMRVKKTMKSKGSKVSLLRFQDAPTDSVSWKSKTLSSPMPSYKVEAYGIFIPDRGEKLGHYGVREDNVLRAELVLMVEPIDEPLHEFKVIEVYDAKLMKNIRYSVLGVDYLQPADDVILYFFGVKR